MPLGDGQTRGGAGLLVSSSRAILYGSAGESRAGGDLGLAARAAAEALRVQINSSRTRPAAS